MHCMFCLLLLFAFGEKNCVMYIMFESFSALQHRNLGMKTLHNFTPFYPFKQTIEVYILSPCLNINPSLSLLHRLVHLERGGETTGLHSQRVEFHNSGVHVCGKNIIRNTWLMFNIHGVWNRIVHRFLWMPYKYLPHPEQSLNRHPNIWQSKSNFYFLSLSSCVCIRPPSLLTLVVIGYIVFFWIAQSPLFIITIQYSSCPSAISGWRKPVFVCFLYVTLCPGNS